MGTELAHNALLLAPVSTSHIETSLFPCVADIIQDCSCGCVVKRLTLLPANHIKQVGYWRKWIHFQGRQLFQVFIFLLKVTILTLVMPNKLRCHAQFQFSACPLDQGCWYKFTYWMTNSADPDQLASSEAKWSGSTLFAKAGYIRQDKG